MFTGLVEKIGQIIDIKWGPAKKLAILTLEVPKNFQKLKIGSSVCVNGVCLTVVAIKKNRLSFELIQETLSKSRFKTARVGDWVNLEKPVAFGRPLDGHLVTGHVEAVGTIHDRLLQRGQTSFLIRFPKACRSRIVPKGSIAVDGVSLTIGKVKNQCFWVHITSHTLKNTLFFSYQLGDRVNLETDLLLKTRS